MKHIVLLLLAILVLSTSFLYKESSAQACPNRGEIVDISAKDQWIIEKLLRIIVPQTFQGAEYKKWEVEYIRQLDKNRQLFKKAEQICGKEISRKSWVVQIRFIKTNQKGQLFLVRSKEKGWIVWYKQIINPSIKEVKLPIPL